jgi:hypothetical protein
LPRKTTKSNDNVPRKRTKSNDSALIATKVAARANVRVSDLFGFGKAANTDAGRKVGETVGRALAGFVSAGTKAAFGRRLTTIEAERITEIARAKGEAKIIEAEYDLQLLARAGLRIRSEETRRQQVIEEATIEAIALTDQSGAPVGELDEEFVARWIAGVQDARSEQVRELWARLLASQARQDHGHVSGPTLNLLKNLDGRLASVFAEFLRGRQIFGCYPVYKGAHFTYIAFEDLQLLEELGFITRVTYKFYRLRELKVVWGALHNAYELTVRARQISSAIFANNADDLMARRHPSQQEVIDEYVNFIVRLVEHVNHDVTLYFSSDRHDYEILVRLGDKSVDTRMPFDAVAAVFGEHDVALNLVQLEVLRGVLERTTCSMASRAQRLS